MQKEYTTCEIRKFLQQLFPHRQLVLSQFTFYNHIGVSKPSGSSFKRGRRCYKASDVLPIVVILALKEEGIPLKNLGDAVSKIQENISKIFDEGKATRLMGFGSHISLNIEGEINDTSAVDAFLADPAKKMLFWNIDVAALAADLCAVIAGEVAMEERQRAYAA